VLEERGKAAGLKKESESDEPPRYRLRSAEDGFRLLRVRDRSFRWARIQFN
jgi:hypothetical protein